MTVRIGIIGCGGIANGKHMPALSQVKEAEMVAFCDLIVERAVEAKNSFRYRRCPGIQRLQRNVSRS